MEKTNVQIIVIDDNSKQDRLKFIELTQSYDSRKNVTFIYNNKGKGAGGARNTGLLHAKGEWVIFADDDDYFLDGFYSIVSKDFIADVEVVFYPMTSMDVRTHEISDRHHLYSELVHNYLSRPTEENHLKLKFKFGVPWSKMIKRNYLIKNNIIFDEVISANDYSFSTKVGFYLKNYTINNNIFYCVTRNKGSLTNIISEEVFESRVKVYIWNYKFLKNNLSNKEFKKLDLNAFSLITRSLEYKRGIKNTFLTLVRLKKNNIKILDYKWFNPSYIINKFISHNRKKVKEIYVK